MIYVTCEGHGEEDTATCWGTLEGGGCRRKIGRGIGHKRREDEREKDKVMQQHLRVSTTTSKNQLALQPQEGGTSSVTKSSYLFSNTARM